MKSNSLEPMTLRQDLFSGAPEFPFRRTTPNVLVNSEKSNLAMADKPYLVKLTILLNVFAPANFKEFSLIVSAREFFALST